jgi:hypothetical protein
MTMILDGTNGETFPSWTTAGRPASPSAGQVGWNTTLSAFDQYNGTYWASLVAQYNVSYLVVAGGGAGGGGTSHGGGGGAGTGSTSGGNGGSGIVIISYSGTQRGTGGTVTSSGGNTIHTFTSSGTYTA